MVGCLIIIFSPSMEIFFWSMCFINSLFFPPFLCIMSLYEYCACSFLITYLWNSSVFPIPLLARVSFGKRTRTSYRLAEFFLYPQFCVILFSLYFSASEDRQGIFSMHFNFFYLPCHRERLLYVNIACLPISSLRPSSPASQNQIRSRGAPKTSMYTLSLLL